MIGWSLGGKIASLAIARGILAPKLFVQISSSFQFKPGAGLDISAGGQPSNFHRIFSEKPDFARDLLSETMIKGDSREAELRELIRQDQDHDSDWLRWIVNARFGMDDVDFREMPRMLIVHGQNDALVNAEQAALYEHRIPGSRLEILPKCGHLPHLHAPDRISASILEEWNLLGSKQQRVRR